MATKNCPKCDSPNPVACKKCACGHVFFTTRRSANAIAERESAEDISEPTTPQEPEVPRRRTARVTRERPQFYDALQVENQTRRQRELQRRRKASKSDDVDVSAEDAPEKPVASTSSAKRRAESPPAKAAEPPAKKRRGRPPGLTNRKTGRAQILSNKPSDAGTKAADTASAPADDELEVGNMHDVPPMKALQMNMVLSDINSRIATSGTRAEDNLPPPVGPDTEQKDEIDADEGKEEPMDEEVTKDTIKELPQCKPVKKDSIVNEDEEKKASDATEASATEEGKDVTEILETKIEISQDEKVGKHEASEGEAVKAETDEEDKEPQTELENQVAVSKDDIKLIDVKGEKSDTETEKETGSKIDKPGNENSLTDEIKQELLETSDPAKDIQAKEKEPAAAIKIEEKPVSDGKVLTDTNGIKKDEKESADDGEKKNVDVMDKVGENQDSGLSTPADSKESEAAEICSS